jgi:hypothetical protein
MATILAQRRLVDAVAYTVAVQNGVANRSVKGPPGGGLGSGSGSTSPAWSMSAKL